MEWLSKITLRAKQGIRAMVLTSVSYQLVCYLFTLRILVGAETQLTVVTELPCTAEVPGKN